MTKPNHRHLNNETPVPMQDEPVHSAEVDESSGAITDADDDELLAGGRTPQTPEPRSRSGGNQNPRKRGGDVERDVPGDEDTGQHGHRGTQHDEHETDQPTGGRSRPGPGKSRGM